MARRLRGSSGFWRHVEADMFDMAGLVEEDEVVGVGFDLVL